MSTTYNVPSMLTVKRCTTCSYSNALTMNTMYSQCTQCTVLRVYVAYNMNREGNFLIWQKKKKKGEPDKLPCNHNKRSSQQSENVMQT